MKFDVKKTIGVASLLFFMAIGVTACGDSVTGGETSSGRLISVSDTEIVIDTSSTDMTNASPGAASEHKRASGPAVDGEPGDGKTPPDFDENNKKDRKSDFNDKGASGSAIDGKGPDDGKTPPDFDDNKSGNSNSNRKAKFGNRPNRASGGAIDEGSMQTKKFTITDKTKIYKISNGETIEISLDEVELGSTLNVVATGDEATSITVSEEDNRALKKGSAKS